LQLSLQQPWWTRTQRIRIVSGLALEVQVDQTESPPAYQRIAPRTIVLHQLGLSDSAIGRRLAVSDKTIAKAIKWHLEQPEPTSGWAPPPLGHLSRSSSSTLRISDKPISLRAGLPGRRLRVVAWQTGFSTPTGYGRVMSDGDGRVSGSRRPTES